MVGLPPTETYLLELVCGVTAKYWRVCEQRACILSITRESRERNSDCFCCSRIVCFKQDRQRDRWGGGAGLLEGAQARPLLSGMRRKGSSHANVAMQTFEGEPVSQREREAERVVLGVECRPL